MLDKINRYIDKYAAIFSLISISACASVIQFLGYLYSVSYYNYFNIDSSFIEISTNLLTAFIITILYLIFLIIETYLFYNMISLIIFNYKNIFHEKRKIAYAVCGLLLYILAFWIYNALINYYITNQYTGAWEITSICLVIGLLASLFIKIYKLFSQKSGVDNKEDKHNLILFILLLIACCFLLTNQTTRIGKKNAENAKTFLININKNKVILYNNQNTSIMANYEYYEESNSIVIYTNELEKTNNDNMKFTTKTFDKVKVKY